MKTTTIRAAAAAITIAAGAMLPSFADRTLNDGLVAYLSFDDGTAANVVAGSPVTPEQSTGTAPTYVNNGMVGKCLNLPNSGSGAYVKLTGSDTGTLDYGDDKNNFTAMMRSSTPIPTVPLTSTQVSRRAAS